MSVWPYLEIVGYDAPWSYLIPNEKLYEVRSVAPETMASAMFGLVAATLAEPLRKEFAKHRNNPEAHAEGSTWCGACEHLWSLLPDGDKVAIA